MNKLLCLIAALLMAPRLYAVWPPSTTLAEEPAQGSVAAKENLEAASERACKVVEKLDADEQRLQLVLRDIEEDRKKLKEQDNGHPVR